ncbi:tumor necrosis factor receptor superfamily member 16-like isoform X4 [Acropora muricata]|uniref:tumor necrosis factor receptor superfamily member 16-like isoform X4 n=1 Tax=Acropora muricata TaxID=159855 RepID=UPI0034E53C31
MVGQSDEIYVQTLSRDIISNSAMRLQIVPAIICVCALLWSCVTVLSCPEGTYEGKNGLCCNLCPQGTHLISPCNNKSQISFCQPCPSQTFMDKENNEAKCLPCTRCEPTQIALLECSANQNRKCGCETGTFLELSFLVCVKCKKCPRGEGVESNCSGSSDTKCAPCLEGRTFSDVESFTEPCKNCTQCDGMAMNEECSLSRDTICETASATVAPTTTASTTSSTTSITNVSLPEPGTVYAVEEDAVKTSEEDSDVISPQFRIGLSLALGILGFSVAVILVALKFFYIKKIRNDNVSVSYRTEGTVVTGLNFPVAATSSSLRGLRGRKTTSGRTSNCHGRESDSQGSNCSLQGVSIEGGCGKSKTLVRDLPGHIYFELGRFLNPKSRNNWIKLAGRLGFSDSDVKNFDTYPDQATQRVLDEWGQREGSTVNVLICELKEMKRDDCVQVLKAWES